MLRSVAVGAVQVGTLAAAIKLLFALTYVGVGATSEFWLREAAASAKIAVGIALFTAVALTILLVLPIVLLASKGRAGSPDR